jgi:amino acid efflux transporter
MTAWLFVAWVVTGAPAITLAAGSYLAFAFPMTREEVFAVAAGILLLAYGINLRGIRLSGRVQVAVVTVIVLLLSVGTLASGPRISATNFSPFLPGGVASIGVAAALIFWSYLGYENVSNIAEEFENPKRDFRRSVKISVLLIGVLYFAVAFAIVGTGEYTAGGGVTPFAELLSSAFGPYGGVLVSLLAVIIIFSTVNAYTTGMARVVYAAARDGSVPAFFAKVDEKSGVPRRSLLGLLSLIMISLVVYYSLQLDVQTGFLATSGAAVMTYVVGSLAGVRLLKEQGAARVLPWISLTVSLAILPFIGVLLVPSLAVAVLGFLYGRTRRF